MGKDVDIWEVGKPVKGIFEPVKEDLERIVTENQVGSETGFVVVQENGEIKLREIEIETKESKATLTLKSKEKFLGERDTIKKEVDMLDTDFKPVIDYYKKHEDKVMALGHTHPSNSSSYGVLDVEFESIHFGDYFDYIRLEESGIEVPKLVAYLDHRGISLEGYWKGKPFKTRLKS